MSVRLAARWGASVTVALVLAVAANTVALAGPLVHGRFVPGMAHPLGDRDTVALRGISSWGLGEPGSLAVSIDVAQAGAASAPSPDDLAALSDPIPLDPSAPYVAGLTWDADVQLRADARYFRDGSWRGWQELSVDGLTGDRPGAEERRGTEPYIVTGVDAIQVRVYAATGVPTGLTVRLYSSDPTAADVEADIPASATSGGPKGYSRVPSIGATLPTDETVYVPPAPEAPRLVDNPQPTIHLRSEWKARTPTEWFESVTVQGAAVHHSAGTNDYLPSDVPAILRGIQNLHMDGREFWDIAYNFLIDRFGTIWEGRAGGIDAAPRGAHSHTFNPIVTGVCIMGNFQEEPVPPVAINSLVKLLAWKLTLHGASAGGILLHEGTWPAIIGHKDIPESSTACPGKWLYALLPEIRARVRAAQNLPAAPFTTDVTGDGTADVVSIVGDKVVVHSSGQTTAPAAPFQGTVTVGEFAIDYDLVTAGPSLVGATGADVLARQATTGYLVRLPLTSDGTLGEPVVVGDEAGASYVMSPGDVTGDGYADLVAADAQTGILVVQRGDGVGHVGAPVVAGKGLGSLAAIAAAGDVDGDGTPDLALILADSGTLAFSYGDGNGGFGAPVAVSTGWDGFDRIAQEGDVSGDGYGDLLVTDSGTGRTRTLLGSDSGFLGAYEEWRAFMTEWDAPMSAVDASGSSVPTLLALDPNGSTLVRPVPTSDARAGAAATSEFTARDVVSAAVVGDVDHNGFADVLTVGSDGLVLIHPSTGSGFGTAIVVSNPADLPAIQYIPNETVDIPPDLPVTRPYWIEYFIPPAREIPAGEPFWSEFASVAPAGDIDFDGTPDLVAVTRTGDVMVFPLNPTDLAHPGRGLKIAQNLAGYRVIGLGPWKPGSISDLLAVSPAGDVRMVTGEGMTGARVGKLFSGTWGADAQFSALGQVGESGWGATTVYDPTADAWTTFGWTSSGNWTALDGAPVSSSG